MGKLSNRYAKIKPYFTAQELYRGFDTRILDKYVTKWDKDSQDLAGKLLIRCFCEILLDVIDNNAIFVLPLTFDHYSEIYLKKFSDKEFIELYKKGRWRNMDFIKSEWTAYMPTYHRRVKNRLVEKPLYVTGMLKEHLDKKNMM